MIGILGSTGRIGKLLIQEALNNNIAISALYVRENASVDSKATNDMNVFLQESRVVIDFSSPSLTHELLTHAMLSQKPLVIGTTGLDDSTLDLIHKASLKMPILYSTNMSEGIAILNKVVSMLSEKLSDYDIEIFEIHHRYKKDSPSGTALTLAESAANARGLGKNNFITNRNKVRDKNDIGISSLRGGDIAGRHTVGFYQDGEFLELTHNANSRAIFAKGALRAAQWLVNQENGLYSMQDIFEI